MYKLFLPLIFMAIIPIASAQPVKMDSTTGAYNSNIEELLVQIALDNYADHEIAQLEVVQARKELTLSKLRWTENFRVFYNFNDQLLENASTYTRPIYGLGIGVSVGDFITLPTQAKIAKQDLKMAKATLEKQQIAIKAEVLRRYYQYILAMDILKVRIQSYEDASSSYQIISKQFRDGKATLAQVDDAGRLMYKTQEEKLTMEAQVHIAKLTLEEMLTMKLEHITLVKPVEKKK